MIVQIREVQSCKIVVLLMFTNSGFRCETLKYVQCSPAMRLICRCSGIEFSAAKRIEMSSAVMKLLRFADTQESCFEAWNRSHIGCSALLFGRFADFEELRFQASKRSNMGSAVLEVGRSVNITNSVFKL